MGSSSRSEDRSFLPPYVEACYIASGRLITRFVNGVGGRLIARAMVVERQSGLHVAPLSVRRVESGTKVLLPTKALRFVADGQFLYISTNAPIMTDGEAESVFARWLANSFTH